MHGKNHSKHSIKKIIISRTDSIGDVVLTLPAAGLMKKLYPDVIVSFIGRSYTQYIIQASKHVDEFINWDTVSGLPYEEQQAFFDSLQADAIVHVYPNRTIAMLAFRSGIKWRIGTSHRFHHWLYCNKLVWLGRKRSALHESQLNLKLFHPLGADDNYSLQQIPEFYDLEKIQPLNDQYKILIDPDKFNLILHPKSKGSAREWGLANFGKLIEILPKDQFKIFISGTIDDQNQLISFLQKYKDEVTDITGKLSLPEFISFIANCDGLVAASTGPLHIAAALGKRAIGIYAPMRPIHPGRWSPVGTNSDFLVLKKECSKCKGSDQCECILSVNPQDVFNKLKKLKR